MSVQLVAQPNEVGHFLVNGFQVGRRDTKESFPFLV
jgi:hypothetical protein